ncbi:necrosis inducing protein-domain-containing protein [Podospora aff. communis PSN243]|uniref:Necrosis inducing protein-domain-containing protein n=1 Tax=Podospora aff. communis PSN243 TaxID=3040156 RepID=A0AAV9GDX1_9PEZI|nr:necrosis inducing protein-domain-containing protein [Podospora aff. communis PSN243]
MTASKLLFAGLITLATALSITRRAYVPAPLPLNAPLSELNTQPSLDFDKDSCYNVAAIGPDGTFAEGMKPSGAFSGGCRDESDLDNSNVYSRSRCNGDWCVTIYDYYFEKDTSQTSGVGGHRHDWEHVAVWTNGGSIEYVATSAHGGYTVKSRKDVLFHGDQGGAHPLVVYHKDGGFTHAFRFANGKDVERPENHKGVFWRGALVGWEGYPDGLRDQLVEYEWEGPAAMAITDEKFADEIKKAKPKGLVFDEERDF